MHYWGEPVNEEKSIETINFHYKQAESGRLLPILVAMTSITTLIITVIVIMIIIIIMIVLTWPQLFKFFSGLNPLYKKANLLCLVATSCKWKLPYLKRSNMATRQMRHTDKTRSPNCTVLSHSIRIGKTAKNECTCRIWQWWATMNLQCTWNKVQLM